MYGTPHSLATHPTPEQLQYYHQYQQQPSFVSETFCQAVAQAAAEVSKNHEGSLAAEVVGGTGSKAREIDDPDHIRDRLNVCCDSSMNLEPKLLSNIKEDYYFTKDLAVINTFEGLLEEAKKEATHINSWGGMRFDYKRAHNMVLGKRKQECNEHVNLAPMKSWVILYKMFCLRPTAQQIKSLFKDNMKVILRCIGVLYVRFTQPPSTLLEWLEIPLKDESTVQVCPKGLQEGTSTTVAKLTRNCLLELTYLDTRFPRIPHKEMQKIREHLQGRKEKSPERHFSRSRTPPRSRKHDREKLSQRSYVSDRGNYDKRDPDRREHDKEDQDRRDDDKKSYERRSYGRVDESKRDSRRSFKRSNSPLPVSREIREIEGRHRSRDVEERPLAGGDLPLSDTSQGTKRRRRVGRFGLDFPVITSEEDSDKKRLDRKKKLEELTLKRAQAAASRSLPSTTSKDSHTSRTSAALSKLLKLT